MLYKLTNYPYYVFVCSYLTTYVHRLPSHSRLINPISKTQNTNLFLHIILIIMPLVIIYKNSSHDAYIVLDIISNPKVISSLQVNMPSLYTHTHMVQESLKFDVGEALEYILPEE